MADYSGTPLAKKLGIKEGHRVAVVNDPGGLPRALAPLPQDVRMLKSLRAPVDVAVLFVTTAGELDRRFDRMRDALSEAGGFWVAWPKKSSKIESDLTFEIVQERGLEAGVVDNKSCSIDDDWQALRFVYRVKDRATRRAR
jgi:hypothetical protein